MHVSDACCGPSHFSTKARRGGLVGSRKLPQPNQHGGGGGEAGGMEKIGTRTRGKITDDGWAGVFGTRPRREREREREGGTDRDGAGWEKLARRESSSRKEYYE